MGRLVKKRAKKSDILYGWPIFYEFNQIIQQNFRFTCSKCPLSHKNKWVVATHISKQHGYRDIFLNEALLKKKSEQTSKDENHISTSSSDKILVCNICDKKFIQPFLLLLHYKKKHEPDNLHKCQLCHNRYTTLNR